MAFGKQSIEITVYGYKTRSAEKLHEIIILNFNLFSKFSSILLPVTHVMPFLSSRYHLKKDQRGSECNFLKTCLICEAGVEEVKMFV